MSEENPNVVAAKKILYGKDKQKAASLDQLSELAARLTKDKAFNYARRILALARKHQDAVSDRSRALKLAQKEALCTYKDLELPADKRFEMARDILDEADPLLKTKSQETLGLAGAIHKRKWEVDNQKQHLESSLSYYRRGYLEGVASDYGYTGINTAFVLDVLARLEEKEAERAGATSESAVERRAEAEKIRNDIVATLINLSLEPGTESLLKDWWVLVTIAEAYFGLERYVEAGEWLSKAKKLPEVEEWQFESTAVQLAAIARLHDERLEAGTKKPEESEAGKVLAEFLDSKVAVRTVFLGKVGLGLSGGGFRASLFHIGVLARLAELDMLRHVEVLSCVSGGSILGAHYYLELRKLLQTKADGKIKQQDYIDIVERVVDDFLQGVQTNIRMRVASEPITNIKMLIAGYSRTERVGELYEEKLYARVKDGGGKKRYINDLIIAPQTENGTPDKNFNPKNNNWRREAKVPIIIFNAATLNTGHNWQFTATWMGESPSAINTEVDGNYCLRRMYYHQAPNKYKKVRLGTAVGASACVPGLFEPITLPDLYQQGIAVSLVDGGVQDNQGITGLLEQDCTVVLISDASGQMGTVNTPKNDALRSLLRSNSIFQARIRVAEFQELDARRRSSLLRGLMFLHLKKDLDDMPVDWIGTDEPFDPKDDPRDFKKKSTSYGISKEVQKRLADIRTDLDSFHEAEAYALMLSGYRMAEHEFPRSIKGFPITPETRVKWKFLSIEEPMKESASGSGAQKYLLRLLDVSSGLAFKVWKLSKPLKFLAWMLGIAALIGIPYLIWQIRNTYLIKVSTIVWTILAIVASVILGQVLSRIVWWRSTLRLAGAGLLAALVTKIHLAFFDSRYLKYGRVKKVLKQG
jgi:predicted acylesterase/phospholipase RssA